MVRSYFYCIAFLFCCIDAGAQEFIPLWQKGRIPNLVKVAGDDSIANERIYRVGNPGMYAFYPSKQENKGAAVIICPGGGYERLAYVISGTQLAKWFNTMGVSAFVLNYRLPNDSNLKDHTIAPIQDAQRALKVVRSNAIKWGIDPGKVGMLGSSAGGHLASLAGTFNEDLSIVGDELDQIARRPDFLILVSPVIDMGEYTHKGSRKNLLGTEPSNAAILKYSSQLKVTEKTPPCFIVAAFNDKSVDPINSVLFYQALLRAKVPSSLHIFPQGGHSIALRNNPGSTEMWTKLCEDWLVEMNLIQQ